jgi:hypothetical protein
VAAGITIAIGDVTLNFTESFSLGGIALGTIMTIAGFHLVRVIAPPHLKDQLAAESGAPSKVDVADQRGSADAAEGPSPA